MRNKILIIICSGIIMVSCDKKEAKIASASTEVNSDSIKKIIQEKENAYATASIANNAGAIVNEYYAEDAVTYGADKAPISGKAEIKASLEKEMMESPKGAKVVFTTNEVHVSNDYNQVVELGSYKVSDSLEKKMASGNFMAVFHKKDGKYLCVRDMSASDQPKPKK